MAKEFPTSLLSQSSFEDHPIFEWLAKNSRNLLYTVLGFVLLLGITYRYMSKQHYQAEQDYFLAANAIEAMQDPQKAHSALTEIQAVLKRRPELQAKYDGILAQNLILEKNLSEASVYAERNFERVSKEINPLFLEFASNSLLLESGKKEEALANATALKEKMLQMGKEDTKDQFGNQLYLFNLIRIAMLQHALQNTQAEAKSWEELLQINRLEHPLHFHAKDVEKVMSHFNDQSVSLYDFIQKYMNKA